MKARDIQLKYLVTIVGASTVALAALGMLAVREISELTRDRVHSEALDAVALHAKEIERFFAERGRVVTTVFANPELLDWFADYDQYLRPLEGDPGYERVLAYLNAVKTSDPTITEVFLSTESTGECFASQGRIEREGYDPRQRWWWREALARDRLSVSPIGVGVVSGQAVMMVQTTMYLPDGRFLGVGGVEVQLDTLAALVEGVRYREVGDAFLVNSDGQLIHFPGLRAEVPVRDDLATGLAAVDRQFPATSGFTELEEDPGLRQQGLRQVSWRGEECVVVLAPVRLSVPEVEWALGLVVPEQLINAATSRTRRNAALAILLAVAGIGGLILLVTHRINSALRAEDQRRAEILAEANLKLLATDRMKSQFLANMSHELRTPLNSIIGFSDILRSRLHDQLDSRMRRFLDHIHFSGEHLLSMISDILDLSKVEAGRMDLHPEELSVADIIDGVCSIVQGIARERQVSLHVGVATQLPALEADPVRFKQILFNLVSNAVKFSHEGSVVTVVAAQLSEQESSLGLPAISVSVIDTGIGISAEDQRLIFEEFRQADGSHARKHGGTGLGLALVRRLVELHRGTITVDSSPGKGSTFTVILPQHFIGPPAEPIRLEPVELQPRTGNLVLVVEDDIEAYQRMSRDLEAAGYRTVCSRDGSDAVALACRLSPVAIVLDLVLPAVDGWEILRQLKAREDTRRTPVIIVSVLGNHALGLALGAEGYFVKPLDRERFLDRLVELAPSEGPVEPLLLLIDDDPQLHDLLEELLCPSGYLLQHALSGAEGVQAARKQRPDLIILDLMMEDMDGFEVAGRLKQHQETRSIPIVVFTARQTTATDRDRLRGKIEALVEKGEGCVTELVPLINNLLSRS